MPGGHLEREPAAERVTDPDRWLGADRLDEQADVLREVPGWLYGDEPWPSRSGAMSW